LRSHCRMERWFACLPRLFAGRRSKSATMYLSDRDLGWAIEKGLLIVDPPPQRLDPTSIDIHLDHVDQAKIWDTQKFIDREKARGADEPEVHLGSFSYGQFSKEYQISPPIYRHGNHDDPVCRRRDDIVVRPGGFLLWQTRERLGTPTES